MRVSPILMAIMVSGCALVSGPCVQGQGSTAPNSPAATVQTPDYSSNPPGVLIMDSGWQLIDGIYPSKSHVKNGLADSVSYGAVPAKMVSDYPGVHAAVQIQAAQPWICICHIISLPGGPAIVRLHSKKDLRQLDAGNLRVLQVKLEQADKSDLIPTDITQPEAGVWLVRPQQALPAGEYALMLGTQNVNIFPFTVVASPTGPPPSPAKP
ncbi:MAG: hypothetical protein WBF35_01780 [Candidatus Acidiferrales bacterium]